MGGSLPPVAIPGSLSAATRRAIISDGIIIGVATGVFGVAFGVLAATTGLTLAQTMALSLLVFTGASQFAVVGITAAGGSPLTALGSSLLLAARNGFYGMTMARHIEGSLLKRLVAAQLTIDESAALATAQEADDVETGFWAGGVGVFVFWNLGTLIGALGGSAIGDPAALGLDAAFPAGFIALIMPALRKRPGQVAAVAGGIIALIAVPFTPAGAPIMLAVLGAAIAFVWAGRARIAAAEDL